jgi:hypothetical protein
VADLLGTGGRDRGICDTLRETALPVGCGVSIRGNVGCLQNMLPEY